MSADDLYAEAARIGRGCQRGGQDTFVRLDRKRYWLCADCSARYRAAWEAARKAQLAERTNDCMRCAARPSTMTVCHRYLLCGRCTTATRKERNADSARLGWLSFGATYQPDTSDWKGLPAGR